MSFFPIIVLECINCNNYNYVCVFDIEGHKEFVCETCGQRLIWEREQLENSVTYRTEGCNFVGFSC